MVVNLRGKSSPEMITASHNRAQRKKRHPATADGVETESVQNGRSGLFFAIANCTKIFVDTTNAFVVYLCP